MKKFFSNLKFPLSIHILLIPAYYKFLINYDHKIKLLRCFMGCGVVLSENAKTKSPGEGATMLRQVVDKVEQGSMRLGQNENRIILDSPLILALGIRVEEE